MMAMDGSDASSETASPTVAVVGPGAIGATVAALLHETGRTPALYGRTPRDHLELWIGNESITVPGPVRVRPQRNHVPVDCVFLAVKTTQIAEATPWLESLCGPETVVCVLQNGVEQVAMVSQHVAHGATIIPAVVWFPAQPQRDGSVELRGDARLTLPSSAAATRVATILNGTRCQVDIAQDFTSLAWQKLLQNAVAGLMALTGRRSGVFRRPDIADLAERYLTECANVARAEGAQLDNDIAHTIVEQFQAFPKDMGTSILTDRAAGRPLEWDIRNGVIARLGRKHGIATPVSDIVATLLAATSDGPG